MFQEKFVTSNKYSLIFKTVEDETAKFGIRISSSLKDIFSDIQFKFDDSFVEDLDEWERTFQKIQNLAKQPDADLPSLISQNLAGAPQEIKDIANEFDFLNGSVSELSVRMKQSALATEATGASFKKIQGLINTFNNDLDNTGLSQSQFADGVSKGNSILGYYFANVDKGKASFGGYIKQLVKTKAATIGMEVATMALNAAISAGIMALINFGIKALDDYIHKAQIAAEQAREDAAEAKQNAEAMRDEASSIDELIDRYQELANKENRDAATSTEIRDIQSEIANLIGDQADNLDLVNGSLDDQLAKLQSISKALNKQVLDAAMVNYNAQVEASKKAVGTEEYFGKTYDYVGGVDTEVMQILRNAGFAENFATTPFGKMIFNADNDYRDEFAIPLKTAAEKYQYLEDARKELEKAMMPDDYASNAFVSGLIKSRDYYYELAQAVNKAANEALLSVVELTGNNGVLSEMVVDSADSFESYKNEMIELVSGDVHLAAMIADGVLSPEDIETAVITWMSTLDEFSAGYNAWRKSFETDIDKDAPKISFKDLMVDDSGFRKATDKYIEQKKKLEDAKSQIGKEGFEDVWNSLIPEFPELSGQYDKAEEAIDNAIDALTGHGTIYTVAGKVKEEATGVTAAIEDAYKQIEKADLPALTEYVAMSLGIGSEDASSAIDPTKVNEYISGVQEIYSAMEDGISNLELRDLSLKYPELNIDWKVAEGETKAEAGKAVDSLKASIKSIYDKAIIAAAEAGDIGEVDRLLREWQVIELELTPPAVDFTFDYVSSIRGTISELQSNLSDLINGELDEVKKANLVTELWESHSETLLGEGITDLSVDNLESSMITLIEAYKQQVIDAFDAAINLLYAEEDGETIAMLESAKNAYLQYIEANMPKPEDFEFAADKVSGYISDIEGIFGSLEDGITRRELMDLSLKFPDLNIDFTVPDDQMETEAKKAIESIKASIVEIYNKAIDAASTSAEKNQLIKERDTVILNIDSIGIEVKSGTEIIKDAIDNVQSGSNLLKDALQELHDAGENSLDTISALYGRFGDNAAGMYSIADGKYVVDTQAVKEAIIKEIDDLQGFTDAEKLVMKATLDVEVDKSTFDEAIDSHVSKINTLQDTLKKVRSGEMDDSALFELVKEFPELATETENLDEAIVKLLGDMNEDVIEKFNEQIEKCETEESREQLEALRDIVLDLGEAAESTSLAIDIDIETKGLENLYTAIEESGGDSGMGAESIEALIKRYKDLEGYDADALFEQTAIGIRVNTEEAYKLEEAYQKIQKNKLYQSLAELRDELERTKAATEGLKVGTTEYNDALQGMRSADAIQRDIDNTAILIGQYDGLTSAYYRWQQAKNAPDKGSEYDAIRSEKEEIDKIAKEGGWGSDRMQSYMELLTGQDVSGDPVATKDAYESLDDKIKGTDYSINDFLKEDAKGAENYVKALSQANEEFATLNKETGEWTVNGSAEEWAKELGTSVEFAESMLDKLKYYGLAGDFGDTDPLEYVEDRVKAAEETAKSLAESGGVEYEPIKIDTGKTDPKENGLEACQKVIEELSGKEVLTEFETAQLDEAKAKLELLINSINQPQFMTISTDQIDAELQGIHTQFVEYQNAVNKLNTLKATPGVSEADIAEAQSKVDELAIGIANIENTDALAKVGVEFKDGAGIEEIKAQISNANFSINPLQQILEAEGKVKWINDDAAPSAFKSIMHHAYGTLTWKNDSSSVDAFRQKTLTKTATVKWVNKYASGTAHAYGSAFATGTFRTGNAFKNGNWGIQGSGTALGGELGQELVVRKGRFFTIGDNGAEFFKYKPGDIVFNHLQTKQIFANGRISSRGKALAEGSAFGASSTVTNGKITFGGSSSSSSSSVSKRTSNSTRSGKTDKKATEIIDWIEVAIDRIERAIDRFAAVASSSYKALAKRLGASLDQISEVNKEIELQQEAYARYMEEAESIGLSDELKQLVHNGAIDISKYNQKTKELIDNYTEWYEKAFDCASSIDELKESLSELYQERFETIATDYENQLSVFEHQINTFNNALDQLENSGYMGGSQLYEEMIAAEQQKIETNRKQLQALTKAMNEAVQSGTIEVYSEAWYEMQSSIYETQEAIQESESALIEYNNTIRELEWDQFDYLLEQIQQITDESEFLISLMEDSKLFDDNGYLTETGDATMALHGINYNAYMEQARKYGEELNRIQSEIAKDPYNTTLIERREELLGLQQESILAAEDEKQAIKDLVEEGINLELDALQKLIDKYNESLDEAKDLYDYQNKVQSQSEEISRIQKQLTAYSGDTSEENRARLQQLQNELTKATETLEESQYDQYIKDQKSLLDELFGEYERILNERLDDTNALVNDVITSVNSNSANIADTIISASKDVGYSITESMVTTLLQNGDTITEYNKGFAAQLTTLNSAISNIAQNVDAIVSMGDSGAAKTIAGSKVSGYSSGGYVAELQKIAMRNGDDVVTVNTLKRGEAILTPDQTVQFSKLVNNLPVLHNLMDGSGYASAIVNAAGANHSSVQYGDINVSFPIDHVQDYNDFVSKLQKDTKFEKVIEDITIGRLTGGSKLSKYKQRWS